MSIDDSVKTARGITLVVYHAVQHDNRAYDDHAVVEAFDDYLGAFHRVMIDYHPLLNAREKDVEEYEWWVDEWRRAYRLVSTFIRFSKEMCRMPDASLFQKNVEDGRNLARLLLKMRANLKNKHGYKF